MKKIKLSPPILREPQELISVRLPPAIVSLLNRMSDERVCSRSDIVRGLTIQALRARGLVEQPAAPLLEAE